VCVLWCGKVSVLVCCKSPYSSVVEHPLSKRKVGSSILPGGKLLAFVSRAHALCVVRDRGVLHAVFTLLRLHSHRCMQPSFQPYKHISLARTIVRSSTQCCAPCQTRPAGTPRLVPIRLPIGVGSLVVFVSDILSNGLAMASVLHDEQPMVNSSMAVVRA